MISSLLLGLAAGTATVNVGNAAVATEWRWKDTGGPELRIVRPDGTLRHITGQLSVCGYAAPWKSFLVMDEQRLYRLRTSDWAMIPVVSFKTLGRGVSIASAFAVHPDGDRIAAWRGDDYGRLVEVSVWSLRLGRYTAQWKNPKRDNAYLGAVGLIWSPDGRQLAYSELGPGEIDSAGVGVSWAVVWDLATGKKRKVGRGSPFAWLAADRLYCWAISQQAPYPNEAFVRNPVTGASRKIPLPDFDQIGTDGRNLFTISWVNEDQEAVGVFSFDGKKLGQFGLGLARSGTSLPDFPLAVEQTAEKRE